MTRLISAHLSKITWAALLVSCAVFGVLWWSTAHRLATRTVERDVAVVQRDQLNDALAAVVLTDPPAKRPAPADTIRAAATYRVARVEAESRAIADARAVERRQDTIRQETTRDLTQKLAAARADTAAHVRRVRANPAAPGGGTAAHSGDLPRAADAVGPAAGAGGAALVDEADAAICAVNTTLAQGWQDWWALIEGARR